jgi:retron-type reverse transcriptase
LRQLLEIDPVGPTLAALGGDQVPEREGPRTLQRALYVTAKRDPARRFHVLYDKVWREDILAHAFALSRANGGAPGVDGVTFAQIEAYGVARWLGELREEVRTGRDIPQPVRRVMIPKSGGVGSDRSGYPPSGTGWCKPRPSW